jgi:hypothetical protein
MAEGIRTRAMGQIDLSKLPQEKKRFAFSVKEKK